MKVGLLIIFDICVYTYVIYIIYIIYIIYNIYKTYIYIYIFICIFICIYIRYLGEKTKTTFLNNISTYCLLQFY